MKPEGFSFPLTVLISDPAAKTKRSDDDQSQGRTLFVGGLNSKTTRTDVEQLLREHGEIVDVKLGWDRIKALCKGFAFVEMATEVSTTLGGLADPRLQLNRVLPLLEVVITAAY